MNAKITIEALIPVGYTDELLAQHVRQVLPREFRVFDVKVEQTESEHGTEARRPELRKPEGNPAHSAALNAEKLQRPKASKTSLVEAVTAEEAVVTP